MEDLKKAVHILETVILIESVVLVASKNITPSETYMDLKESYKVNKAFAFDTRYSDKTIFNLLRPTKQAKNINAYFRAWHDSLHLKYNLDFTTKSEYLVSLKHRDIVVKYCDKFKVSNGIKLLAMEIINIEINEQRKYYNTFGKFVEDQEKFLLDTLITKGWRLC